MVELRAEIDRSRREPIPAVTTGECLASIYPGARAAYINQRLTIRGYKPRKGKRKSDDGSSPEAGRR
jgi:hypothetical protein